MDDTAHGKVLNALGLSNQWGFLTSNVSGNGVTMSIVDTNKVSRRFYRIQV